MSTPNRRQEYRHVFRPKERPWIELYPVDSGPDPQPLLGRVVNLSMGGVGVLLEEPIPPGQCDGLWTARLTLPGRTSRQSREVALICGLCHAVPPMKGCFYGFHFRDLEKGANSRMRQIVWQFLLQAQVLH